MQPYFEQDDIHLVYDTRRPAGWPAASRCAVCKRPRWIATVGQAVDAWLPRGRQRRHRCVAYRARCKCCSTLTLSMTRVNATGLLPVNSFWLSGSGHLPANNADGEPPGLRVDYRPAGRRPAGRLGCLGQTHGVWWTLARMRAPVAGARSGPAGDADLVRRVRRAPLRRRAADLVAAPEQQTSNASLSWKLLHTL
jgi:hypothetical protein